MSDKKKVYRVTVKTTNSNGNVFEACGSYYACEDGFVYVVAEDIYDAACQLRDAIEINEIGWFYSPLET